MLTLSRLRSALALSLGTLLVIAWSSPPITLTRGPFLQGLSASDTRLVFRTSSATTATLHAGRNPGGPWELEQDSPAGTTHVIALSDLLADTRYYYEVRVGGQSVTPAGECWFQTAPAPNARRPFRFLAWGDSGTGNSSQFDVAARMEEVFPQAAFALGLGDLVYPNGEAENYDPRFFTPYQKLFRTTAIWPTMGNHDAATANGAPYYDAFHLPTDSGAPGSPSGTELYYSFDHGMAHFVCVDSQISNHAVGSAMYRWLEDDLEHANAEGKRWLVVFMHHPPYSKGTHDSDAEPYLVALREALVPLFEAQGVDLVLTGHSHVYERSYLVKDDAILQAHASSYTKFGSPDGTIYLVNGCGGASGSGSLDHPLMAVSRGNVEGTNVFDVDHDAIRGWFLESDGAVTDLFTLRKAPDATPPRLAGVKALDTDELLVVYDEPVTGGTGTWGAEALSNYSFSSGATLLDANLLGDQRTVQLLLAPTALDFAYALDVVRVEDQGGNRGACEALFHSGGAGGAPAARLELDRPSGNLPLRVELDGSLSSDADGSVVSYRWNFGDGSAEVTGAQAAHIYTSVGLYTVSLVVRDDSGREALASREIRVLEEGNDPQPLFSASTDAIMAGGHVDFDARGSVDPDGGSVYQVWDFGDPAAGPENRSTQPAVRHVFEQAGTFVVTLTTSDDEGSVVTQETTITVVASADDEGGFACAASTGSSSGGVDASFLLASALVLLWISRLKARAVGRLARG